MEIIVNVTRNWGIGYKGKLLYSIPADLKRFRELTMGRTVVLGRKTLSTFPGGRPLKGRVNIVLSSGAAIEGAVVVGSVEALKAELEKHNSADVAVIGGESVYRELLPLCDRAEITRSYAEPEADKFFPDLDKDPAWRQTDASELYEYEGLKYRYLTYVRV